MKSMIQVSIFIISVLFSNISKANISFDYVDKNSKSSLSFKSSEELAKLQLPQIEIDSIAIRSISDIESNSFLGFLNNNRHAFEDTKKIEFMDQARGFGSEFKYWLLPHLEKSSVAFSEESDSSVISIEFEAPPSPRSIPGSASPEMVLSTSSAGLQTKFSSWVEKFIEESHSNIPELNEPVRENVILPNSVIYLAKLPMEGQMMMILFMKCIHEQFNFSSKRVEACKAQIDENHYRSRANSTCIRLGYDRAGTFSHRPVTKADLGISVDVQRRWYRDMRAFPSWPDSISDLRNGLRLGDRFKSLIEDHKSILSTPSDDDEGDDNEKTNGSTLLPQEGRLRYQSRLKELQDLSTELQKLDAPSLKTRTDLLADSLEKEEFRKVVVVNSEGFVPVTEFNTNEIVQPRRFWAQSADFSDQYLHESHEIFDTLFCEAEKENLERNRAAFQWENFANSGAIEDLPLFNRKTPTKYVDPMIKWIFPGLLKDSP